MIITDSANIYIEQMNFCKMRIWSHLDPEVW